MKSSATNNRPEGLARIYQEAFKLIKPTLAPLYQVFLDEKTALQKQYTALLQKREEVRQEGYDAVMRLFVSSSDDFEVTRGSYFERIKHMEGKDE